MSRVRFPLVAVFCAASGPVFLFVAFGLHAGMPWDYSLVYISDSTHGLAAFLYDGDNLRIFTNVFYNVGYWISILLGLQGSFVGYHVIYALLWSAVGVLWSASAANSSWGPRSRYWRAQSPHSMVPMHQLAMSDRSSSSA